MTGRVGGFRPSLDGLTGLRFFLAIYVVAFHFGATVPNHWLERLRAGGPMLVYCFFVLSGFVMTYVYADPRAPKTSTPRFWILRLARIYPLYILATLAIVPFSLQVAPWSPERTKALLLHAGLAQDWLDKYRLSLNGPGWSVSAEAFFYLCFPLLAWCVARPMRRAALVGGAIACAGGYAVLALGADGALGALADTPLAQALHFVCGMLLGKLFLLDADEHVERPGGVMAALGLAVLIGAMLLAAPDAHKAPLILARAATIVASGLLIYGIAHGRGAWSRALASRPLVLLGDASYAMYILQLPVFMFIYTKLQGRPIAMPRYSLLGLLLCCALLVAVSIAAFLFVERPIRRAVRRWARRQ
jgi:peptidoglycan/LPS O-acetylase OafA/YrhL